MKRPQTPYLAFILLGSFLFSSCQKKHDITGMWIATNNEYRVGADNHFLIHFGVDTLVIYDEWGLPLKANYQSYRKVVEMQNLNQLFSNEFYLTDARVNINFDADTLMWGDKEIKMIRSDYTNYLDHYVNATGLKIELPDKSIFQKTDVNQYHFMDAIFGFKEDGNVGLFVNDFELIGMDTLSLSQIINTSKDVFHSTPICRIFADRNIKMGIINDFLEILKSKNINRIQYVTQDQKRLRAICTTIPIQHNSQE